MSDSVIIHAKPQEVVKIYAGVGTPGAAGSVIYVGSADPSNSFGVNGDLFINNSSWNILRKQGGAWILQGNIKGSNGSNGNGITAITQPSPDIMRVATRDLAPVDITLIAGNNGTNGATWYISSSAPSNDTGVNGDLHVNTTSWQVSVKQSGSWVLQGTIKGDDGATGPSNLNFLKTAQQSIEHFEGNSSAAVSLMYAVTVQNGGALLQRSTAKAGFKSASLIDFSIATSSPVALIVFRKALGTNVFAYPFNPANQLCEMEMRFALDQIPTSANQYELDMRLTDTSNSAFNSSANGVQARIYWDTGLSRAALALTTMEATLTSTETSGFTLEAGVVYTMRIVYNRAANLCQLLVNGVVVASRTLRLPSVFLSPSLRVFKVTGTSAVTGTIDYIETVATDQ